MSNKVKTLQISNEQHRRWKIFCAKTEIDMNEANEKALDLFMLNVKIKKNKK